MGEDHKKSVAAALQRHHVKAAKQADMRPKRHNEKPEKDVEKACMKWMREQGFSVQVIESKATYSPKAGTWLQQGAKQGTADCIGNTGDGTAVCIEFKAPKKLSTLKYNQRQFLVDKINTGVFAIVTDSVERLQIIYARWLELRIQSVWGAKSYLLSMLPEEKKSKEPTELFEED